MKKKEIIYITPKISPYPNTNSFQKAKFLATNYCTHLIMKYKYPETEWMLPYFKSVNIWEDSQKNLPFILWAFIKGLELAKNSFPNVVYSNWYFASIVTGYLMKRFLGCKWILDLWDNPIKHWDFFKEEKLWSIASLKDLIISIISYSFLRLMIHKADYVITIFPQVVKDSFNISDSKIYAHVNGVDLEYIRNFSYVQKKSKKNSFQDFLLFYVGPMRPLHLRYFPQIINELSQHKGKIRVMLVGPIGNSKCKKWIDKNIPKKQGSVSVQITDSLPNTEVIYWMAQADVCLCPYIDKGDNVYGYPIKIFEYMALGKPAVAFELPNLKKIFIQYQNGILVPQGNVKAYVSEIERLLAHDAERDFIGKNAKITAQKYDWNNILSDLKLFLDKIL